MARYLVSHRLASLTGAGEQASTFETTRAGLRAHATVVADRAAGVGARGLMVVDAEPGDMAERQRTAAPDILIEPELPRRPARFALSAAAPVVSKTVGLGAIFTLTVRSSSAPVTRAGVQVMFANLTSGASNTVVATTDAQGRVSIPYDSRTWTPTAVIVTPADSQWSWWQNSPVNGSVVTLADLPSGPRLGWWHQLLGIASYSEARGKGVKVGIADTGVGPHPYLAHVQSAGAFLNGGHDGGANALADVEDHGTHVTGIIGARPTGSGAGYGGIAPGASILAARVYASAAGTATNGDIAAAIDALAAGQCDLINLSMGGSEYSEIELDAITAAIQSGCLVLAAAGNGGGAIEYPAAYPGVVAVSALGVYGTFPGNSIEALAVPTTADQFAGSLFEASFNNSGPHMACTGPGVGVISTVPVSAAAAAPYVSMSGTSMACPAVCAALATLLAADPNYGKLPRNVTRAQYAWNVLVRSLRRLGLNSTYEGYGLARASAT